MTSNRLERLSRRPKVALIVETSLASGRDVLRGIADYVRQQGPWSIYHEPRGLEDTVPRWLHGWDGDGIIARVQNKQIAEAVKATGLPVVDVLGLVPEADLPLVHVDDDAIAHLAADHLLERGFRNFGFCTITGANWAAHRCEYFRAAIEASGRGCAVFSLPPDTRGQRSWEKQEAQLVAWVASLPKPAGVMVCNDPRGQLVLEACRRANVAVPEQVAVVGVDNDEPLCQIADPPLSSVVADHRRVGFEGAALLDRLMAGEEPAARKVFVPPRGIVTRMSTDVLAIDDADVAPVVRFIREHACDGIEVDDVVHHSGFSRSTLGRKFREALGRTVHDEILRVRLRRARELLAETELPIETVADRAGFNHRQYLGKVFKAQFGETLAAYRNRRRG